MELVQQLTSSLGVNEDQAKGGTGLLLNLAKEQLAGTDFAKLTEFIPESGELQASAPETSGGLMGAIGGIASSLGGDAEKLGSVAELIGGFEKLGLDKEMIQKFGATIVAFLRQKGGDSVADILQSQFDS